MNERAEQFLTEHAGVSAQVLALVDRAEAEVMQEFCGLDALMEYNEYKVLEAFRKAGVASRHFHYNTGYGLDDTGKIAIDRVFANVFGSEAALVRPQIVCGTHALGITLAGILRPGDELIYCTGRPYDTLEEVIGIRDNHNGSLKEFGITYKQVELAADGSIDLKALGEAISPRTKLVCAQRATGYAFRKALTMDQIARFTDFVHGVGKDIVCMVDNCYGEFLDYTEPTQNGADVVAGSLIKNPGGGLALTGGYVAGRADLVELVSHRMTTPGLGSEYGIMFDQTRTMLQGLFLAPKTVNGAIKGAILCSRVFENLGFEVSPKAGDARSDIITGIRLKSPEALIAFCEGVQKAAPVDSFVAPEPVPMPGYGDPVIMACGAFVQGSSIELSADGPMREPYAAYFQGGLSYEYSKLGVIFGLQALYDKGFLKR